MKQIDGDPKGNCYGLVWKEIDQQIANGSGVKAWLDQGRDKKCEHWETS